MAKKQAEGPREPLESQPEPEPTAESAPVGPALLAGLVAVNRRVEDVANALDRLTGRFEQALEQGVAERARIEARLAEPTGPAITAGISSRTIIKIIPALAFAQAELENPTKDKTAKVASAREGGASYSYDYADLATVLDAVRPILSKNGIAIVQVPSIEGSRVTVTTVLAHTSGEWLAGSLSSTVADNRPQGIGSAITYLRRYTLQALVGITAEADDDASGAQGVQAEISQRSGQPRPMRRMEAPPEEPVGAPAGADGSKAINQAQRTKLNATVTDRAKELGVERSALALVVKDYMKAIGVASGSSADLPRGRFEEVLKFAAAAKPAREPGSDDE